MRQPLRLRLSLMTSVIAGSLLLSAGRAEERGKKIYIVLTNDHEMTLVRGFTGESGYLSAEDYRIIMLEKARQIKAMLDAYGYPMTWYMDTGTFFPLVLEQQGLPGEAWRGLWPEMENLLRELGAAGHDVSYHTHTMFNQDLSRHRETENWNALRYDPVTQKFCSNPDYRGQTIENPCSRNPERYHLLFPNGHAGAIDEIGTKSWWLYQHNRLLTTLTGRLPLTMRHGGYQVGCDPPTMRTSARAMLNSGILAASDTDGNLGRLAGVPRTDPRYRGYFAAEENHNQAVDDAHWDLIQFPVLANRDRNRRFVVEIAAHLDAVKAMLRDTLAHIQTNEPDGVYLLTAIAHTKHFMGGDGTPTGENWRVLHGGSWDSFAELLSWIDAHYVRRGLVEVVTASTAIKAFIDRHSRRSVAVIGPELASEDRRIREFPVEVLARKRNQTGTSRVNPALLVDYDTVRKIEILEDGTLVKQVTAFDKTDTSIPFPYRTGENVILRITSQSAASPAGPSPSW